MSIGPWGDSHQVQPAIQPASWRHTVCIECPRRAESGHSIRDGNDARKWCGFPRKRTIVDGV